MKSNWWETGDRDKGIPWLEAYQKDIVRYTLWSGAKFSMSQNFQFVIWSIFEEWNLRNDTVIGGSSRWRNPCNEQDKPDTAPRYNFPHEISRTYGDNLTDIIEL